MIPQPICAETARNRKNEMIRPDAEPIAHTPPLKRIDNVPPPTPIPPVNALELMAEHAAESWRKREGDRIWDLVRQSAGDAVPEAHPGACAVDPWAGPTWFGITQVNARFQWEPFVRYWVTQDDIDAVLDSPIWTQEDFDEAVPFGDMCWVTG